MNERVDLPKEMHTAAIARLSPQTFAYDLICAAHEAALKNGENGYRDPVSGLFVMTAAYLWSQGACCEKGCRHCPYIER